jgi:hypothetical protein
MPCFLDSGPTARSIPPGSSWALPPTMPTTALSTTRSAAP